MHGDPHPGNLFISADKKGRLIPIFIDTGSCIVRDEKQIIDDVRFFADYYLGNTKGIARHFVEICAGDKKDKASLIATLAEEFKRKVFERKKITNIKLVFDNMNSILQSHNLKLPEERILATKAQLQFFSLAYNAAKLSKKPLSVITVVKDLPIAIFKMFLHGKKPFSAMLPTIKHGINNIDTAVGTSYQFSINKNLK